MNIPIYRAKRLGVDFYIEGCFLKEYFNPRKLIRYSNIIFIDNASFDEIDPTTLSIHFPNMLASDSDKYLPNGEKDLRIFASLQKDGKGGDIIALDDIIKTVIWCSKTQAIMLNSKQTGLSILSLYKDDIKIIDIQE